MKRLLIIIAIFFITESACKKEITQRRTPPILIVDTTVIQPPLLPTDTSAASFKNYLAIGDSYTIGQAVAINERFPVQTVEKLKNISIFFNEAEIIAQTGYTTSNLINRMNTTPPLLNKYDIVSLLIGVNNQYQRQSQSQYATEFTVLLNKAVALTGNKPNRVFVLSIPDYSVTPFALGSNQLLIANQIDSFNTINLRITQALGANYLNITNSTRQAATDRTLIAIDGLHPSGKEYKKWADNLVPMIKMSLQ